MRRFAAPLYMSRLERIPTEAAVAVRQHQLHTMLIGIHIFLGKVIVLVQVSVDDQRIAFVHALDGLLIAGDNVQHVVWMDEGRGAQLMPLRQLDGRSTIERSIIFSFGIVVCDCFYFLFCPRVVLASSGASTAS